MTLLGFDYGRRHLGVARAVRGIVEPLAVVNYRQRSELLAAITNLCQKYQPELLVWGLPQGPLRLEIEKLARKVAKMVKLPVEFVDETLTTKEAQKWVRRGREDAVAAALILEYFLAERG